MSTLVFQAQITATAAGKTGLVDVVANVWSLTRANPPVKTQVVTNRAALEVGGGVYAVGVASLDPATLDYACVFTTADVTVDRKDVPADRSSIALASDGLDAVLVESGISVGAGLTNDSGTQLTEINGRQALALMLSALAGKLAGAESLNVTVKQAGKPAGNNRLDATVTADNNRTAVALKVPD